MRYGWGIADDIVMTLEAKCRFDTKDGRGPWNL